MKNKINVVNMIRQPKLIKISTKKILISNVKKDKIYLKKYLEYINGERAIFATRLNIDKIKPGFFFRNNNRWKYHCDKIDNEDIALIKQLIRNGHRPSLYAYRNQANDNGEWLCPDDVALLLAYKALKIYRPPVLLLDSTKVITDESQIAIKSNKKYNRYYIKNFMATNKKEVVSLIKFDEMSNYDKILPLLIQKASSTMKKIKCFHNEDSSNKIHYHHTLYSIIHRLIEFLNSIKLLLDKELIYPAAILARSLYELTLNFYLDWLAPEIVGPSMQILSVMDDKHYNDLILKILEKSNQTTSWGKRIHINAAKFMQNVYKKAKLNPLGSDFYEKFYRPLSQLTHQDFSISSEFANTMYDKNIISLSKVKIKPLMQFITLVASQIIIYTDYDIVEVA